VLWKYGVMEITQLSVASLMGKLNKRARFKRDPLTHPRIAHPHSVNSASTLTDRRLLWDMAQHMLPQALVSEVNIF